MTENQNPDPQLDEIDNAGTPPAAPTSAKDDAEQANAGTGVYAVYDREQLRYIGGTHPTRKAADKVKSDVTAKGDRGRYEVREV